MRQMLFFCASRKTPRAQFTVPSYGYLVAKIINRLLSAPYSVLSEVPFFVCRRNEEVYIRLFPLNAHISPDCILFATKNAHSGKI